MLLRVLRSRAMAVVAGAERLTRTGLRELGASLNTVIFASGKEQDAALKEFNEVAGYLIEGLATGDGPSLPSDLGVLATPGGLS